MPKVFVLKPELEADETGLIPHTYPEKRLCLYHPAKHEWSQQMYVAKTIIPWASLWLVYYEFWQMTGEWLGGGEHPRLRQHAGKPIQIVQNLDQF